MNEKTSSSVPSNAGHCLYLTTAYPERKLPGRQPAWDAAGGQTSLPATEPLEGTESRDGVVQAGRVARQPRKLARRHRVIRSQFEVLER